MGREHQRGLAAVLRMKKVVRKGWGAVFRQTGSIVRGEKKVGEVHQQRVPLPFIFSPLGPWNEETDRCP